MKLYLLTEAPYHDGDTILGLYWTLEEAQAQRPGAWKTYLEPHPESPSGLVSYRDGTPADGQFYVIGRYLIYELTPKGTQP